VPNTTGVHASVYGKWYQVYGSGYTGQGGGVNSYDAAVTECNRRSGRLATFRNQYQQYVVETILFPNTTAGVIDTYWVANVIRGFDSTVITDNTTWYYSDTFQWIGALPTTNHTQLYARWGANEPQRGQTWRCAIAVRGLAYDSLGPWPLLERQPGNMSTWGWSISNCGTNRPYICEFNCEQLAAALVAVYMPCAVAPVCVSIVLLLLREVQLCVYASLQPFPAMHSGDDSMCGRCTL
jgi:hypothetical protein